MQECPSCHQKAFRMVYGPPMRTTKKMQCARCGYTEEIIPKKDRIRFHGILIERHTPEMFSISVDDDHVIKQGLRYECQGISFRVGKRRAE